MYPHRNDTLYDGQKEKRVSFPRKNYSKTAFVRRYFLPATVYLNICIPPASVQTELVNPVLQGETPGGRRTFVRGEYRAAPRRAARCSCTSQCSAGQRSAAQRSAGQRSAGGGEQSACGSNRKRETDRMRERERERDGGGKEALCPAIHALHTHEAYPRPSPRPYRPMTGMRSFY